MTGPDEPIRPMTLDNMRRNGVRGLDVTCACGYHTAVNVDALARSRPGAFVRPLYAVQSVRQAWRDRNTELERAKGQRARGRNYRAL